MVSRIMQFLEEGKIDLHERVLLQFATGQSFKVDRVLQEIEDLRNCPSEVDIACFRAIAIYDAQ